MLDPWIIEEIKRREDERRDQARRAVIELPLPGEEEEHREDHPDPKDDVPRGVTIIDFGV